ncbi:MAG: type II toxin-antitoxin system PemK/MazF family toxin [Treponema sp.]|jgi:mRNA interferase MazF|nr:type II toxin-antitoxin system PemK/MazF family toxin [Treponema sp.]
MKRGELYRVSLGSKTDTKRQRVYAVVSRQILLDSIYSTVIGIDEGLKHESAIRCDELISIMKSQLVDYIGVLSEPKLEELNAALAIAVGIAE